MIPVDLGGRRFGRLVVVSRVAGRGKRRWLCQCDCGGARVVLANNLVSGNTQSCDCLRKERVQEARRAHPRRVDVLATTLREAYTIHVSSGRRRGLGALSRDEWERLVMLPCAYCGRRDRRIAKYHRDRRPEEAIEMVGVDRVDSSKPYVGGNCAPCCKQCNKAKSSLGQQEFIAWIRAVAAHQAAG